MGRPRAATASASLTVQEAARTHKASPAALRKTAWRKRRGLDLKTVARTRAALKDPGQWMPLLPGLDHRVIVASSEGGMTSTTDHDDPESIRRLIQAMRLLPKSAQSSMTFVAFVNTSQGKSGMSTQAAMLDLVDHLVRHGIPREEIHLGLPPINPETGNPEPGIYLAYGAEARPRVPNTGSALAGESRLENLPVGETTEVTALMLASPHGLAALPKVHNLCVVGNGRNATNDNYGLSADTEAGRPLSDSQALIERQAETLAQHAKEQGALDHQVAARTAELLQDRRVIHSFEDAHAESLTGAERDEIFSTKSGLSADEAQRIHAETSSKIAQNRAYSIDYATGKSPDGGYGNRAHRAATETLNIDEDGFKKGLAAARKASPPRPGVTGLPWHVRPQLPGLVKYLVDLSDQGLLNVNSQSVHDKLTLARGIPLLRKDGDPDGEQLATYLGAPGLTDLLAAAATIHLSVIETQMRLLFPDMTIDQIPATEAALEEVVTEAGGWRQSRVVDYDTNGASKLLLPALNPTAVACALDLPDAALAAHAV